MRPPSAPSGPYGGVGAWEELSPHSLRHSAITFALDAGASLRDVQDYAGHNNPRTTRRSDHSPRQPGPQRGLYRRCLPGQTASRAAKAIYWRARVHRLRFCLT